MTDNNWQSRIIGMGEASPEELLANPKNYRIHGSDQQRAVGANLDTIGWVEPVIVNQRTGFVVDGHLRVMLSIRRGEPTIPVLYVDLSDAEESQALLTLDTTAAMAGTDVSLLQELLADVDTEHDDVGAFYRYLAEENTVVGRWYDPNVDPDDDAPDTVTADDVEKAKGKLARRMSDGMTFIDLTCPHCGNEFSVEDDDEN